MHRCRYRGADRYISQIPQCIWQIFHNAPLCNRNVHTCVYISVTKWCIMGYLSDALWDLCDRFIVNNVRAVLESPQLTLVRCLRWKSESINVNPMDKQGKQSGFQVVILWFPFSRTLLRKSQNYVKWRLMLRMSPLPLVVAVKVMPRTTRSSDFKITSTQLKTSIISHQESWLWIVWCTSLKSTERFTPRSVSFLTLDMLNCFKDYKRYIHILNHIVDLA